MSNFTKIEIDSSNQFPVNVGTVKGLAAMAVKMREIFIANAPCPPQIGDFWRLLHTTPGGRDFAQNFRMSSSEHAEDLHQVHSLMRWVEFGLPVFDLTHGLMSALLLTDPSDVSADVVHPPFGTFVVRFPEGFWAMEDGYGASMPVGLGVVHSFNALSSADDQPWPMLSLRIVGRNGTTSSWEANKPPVPGQVLGPWLDRDLPPAISASSVASSVNPKSELVAPTDTDRRLIIAFRRLYANLCLYVTERGRGEPLGKRDKRGRPVSSSSTDLQPDVWVLGREVKLDRDLVGAAKAWTDSASPRASDREGWRLKERFTVRGHWRHQAHGPGRGQRKLIWIEPHWRGEGPTFQHVYTSG